MKYRIISLGVILGLISFTLIIGRTNLTIKKPRYHQHIESNIRYQDDMINDDSFNTHLPIIDIKTSEEIPPAHIKRNGVLVQNDDMIKAKLRYIQNEDTVNRITDKEVFSTNTMFRIRGRSSRSFDKKGYLLKFKNEDFTENVDIEIDGMSKDSEWALHGPYLDKTLIRNYLCYNLAGEIMEYSPNVRFCELFINGNYEGLYLIVETIKMNKEGRINITETDSKSPETSYILKIDMEPEDEFKRVKGFLEASGRIIVDGSNSIEIIYPGKTLSKGQKNFIEEEIVKFEKTISSYDLNDRNYGYKRFLDVNSFVDYFLINEISLNRDAMSLSTFMYKDIKGKMKLAVWDFNNAFDNYETILNKNTFILASKYWYAYLLRDKEFTDKVISRYRYLRKNLLSDEYLINYIDETIEYLGPAIDRNYEKWSSGFNFNYLEPIDRNVHSYDEAVAQLKNEILERLEFMDENIESLVYYSHESVNKQNLKFD